MRQNAAKRAFSRVIQHKAYLFSAITTYQC